MDTGALTERICLRQLALVVLRPRECVLSSQWIILQENGPHSGLGQAEACHPAQDTVMGVKVERMCTAGRKAEAACVQCGPEWPRELVYPAGCQVEACEVL